MGAGLRHVCRFIADVQCLWATQPNDRRLWGCIWCLPRTEAAGRAFTVVGDGEQTRDFTYVSDVADAFITVAASTLAGEAVNVGSGGTYSINRLIKLLGGEKTHLPKRPGEPDQTFADVTRIREATGWQAKTSFEDGVAQMLTHIDNWRDAPVWTPDTIADATEGWFKYLSK